MLPRSCIHRHVHTLLAQHTQTHSYTDDAAPGAMRVQCVAQGYSLWRVVPDRPQHTHNADACTIPADQVKLRNMCI